MAAPADVLAGVILLAIRLLALFCVIRPLRALTGLGSLGTVAVLLSIALVSLVPAGQLAGVAAHSPAMFLALTSDQALRGVLMGLPCALALECAAQAGSLIDCARGAQFAEQVNPEYAQSVSVLEEFGLRLGGVALFFFGGMQCLLGRIALSIRRDAFPLVHVINEQAVTQAVGKEIASLCGELLSASVLLACPVFLPCLAIDLIFGVISRVQPRLSLFFDAITLKMLAGVFVLTLLASDIGQQAIFILRRTW